METSLEGQGVSLPARDGDNLLSPREEFRLVRRAIRAEWPITQEARHEAIDRALAIIRGSSSECRILGALKMLVAADMVNVRREANEVQERVGEIAASTGLMRTVMRTPEARQMLSELSAKVCDDGKPIGVIAIDPAPNSAEQSIPGQESAAAPRTSATGQEPPRTSATGQEPRRRRTPKKRRKTER